jgi:hypothetical protein
LGIYYLIVFNLYLLIHFFYYWWGHFWPIVQLQIIDEDDCGAIGRMKIGRRNQSTLRKPAPVPLCPPQIPHDHTWAQTPGRRGGKPATNHLSYGAAFVNP